MPPKKDSAKAVADELKKENTRKAQSIVSQLKLGMGKSEIEKKTVVKRSEKSVTADSSKKRSVQAEKCTDRKRTLIRNESKVSTPITETVNDDPSILTEMVDIGLFAGLGTNSQTTKNVKAPPKTSTSHTTTSVSNESTYKVAYKKSLRPPKARTSHGTAYQYEIDCKQVADSIDVKDLRKHIEQHLKLDGKKGNLGTTVSVLCEGHKVVIKSETFFPKKSLRFLSKKFLKRNWNVRVVSKNAYSYEYKYVGAP